MKEKLIQEVSDGMSEVLTVDQITQLNSVLLQVISKYTIVEDGDKVKEDFASNVLYVRSQSVDLERQCRK